MGPDVGVAGAQDQPEPVVEVVGDQVGTAGLVSRWYFTNSLTGGVADFELTFGSPTEADFYVGDWNGNGIDDLAYRRGKTRRSCLSRQAHHCDVPARWGLLR